MVLKTKQLHQIRGEQACKTLATLLSSFLITFIFASIFAPVESSNALNCSSGVTETGDICSTDSTGISVTVSGGWTISVASAGTLDLNLTPNSSGVLSTTTDNLHIYTNAPNGYQLYLNSSSGSTDIYNTNDTEKEHNHFTATTGTKTSPVSLSNDTWGYSLDTSPTSFSKVEKTSSAEDSLIHTGAKTASEGEDLPITYGFKADTHLLAGIYTTGVTYTVVGEVPSYNLLSVSPNSFSSTDTNKAITILTTVPASELSLGNVTAKITNGTSEVQLISCSETTGNANGTSYRGATCTYPGGLPIDINSYNVELTSSQHSATYVLQNSLTIYQKTMQTFTSADCANLLESTASADRRTLLQDSRDGKFYRVSRLADNNCWMVQNLALDGGRTISGTDSDLPTGASVTLPENIPKTTPASSATMQIIAMNTDIADHYGNLYNFPAATAGFGSAALSGAVANSVCPKNWRLPDNGVTQSAKTYSNLIANYGVPGSGEYSSGTAQQYLNKLFSQPLFFTLSGWNTSRGVEDASSRMIYWTRTDSDYSPYTLYGVYRGSNSYFNPQRDGNHLYSKSNAVALRCVLE